MMASTIQHPEPLKAAEYLEGRYFGTVGSPDLIKIRVYESTRGRQLAIVLENSTLTVFSEPVHDPEHESATYHKRRYGPGETRHANLNFDGCRLGADFAADSWVFPTQSDFWGFVDWYADLWGKGRRKRRPLLDPEIVTGCLRTPVRGLHALRAYLRSEQAIYAGLPMLEPVSDSFDELISAVDGAEKELEAALARGAGRRELRDFLVEAEESFLEVSRCPWVSNVGATGTEEELRAQIDRMLERRFEELKAIVAQVGCQLRGEDSAMPTASWMNAAK